MSRSLETPMMRSRRNDKPGWQPMVLTTAVLYSRVGHVLCGMKRADPRGLIIILPRDNPRMRQRLLAIGRDFQRRGGTIDLIDEDGVQVSISGSGMEPESSW
jgi:hypothetical protein